eukprot:m.107376 g.107376  ORF g.107376 m.107376 type:complete len:279 (-) comp16918_c0_seq1:171-1007(-)
MRVASIALCLRGIVARKTIADGAHARVHTSMCSVFRSRFQPQSYHTSLGRIQNRGVATQGGAARSDDRNPESTSAQQLSLMDRFIKRLGVIGGFYSQNQLAMRAARNAYMTCCDQSSHREFIELTGLPDNFQSWFLIQQLHVWMLMVRAKQEGSLGATFYKQLVQFFWDDVEHRMRLMKIDDVTIKTESARELNSMFYGLLFAYDEGLVKDDHVLASAVWRNLFHHTKGTATARDVAQLVAYIRREVHALDGVDAKDLLERGAVSFGAPPAVCVESTE